MTNLEPFDRLDGRLVADHLYHEAHGVWPHAPVYFINGDSADRRADNLGIVPGLPLPVADLLYRVRLTEDRLFTLVWRRPLRKDLLDVPLGRITRHMGTEVYLADLEVLIKDGVWRAISPSPNGPKQAVLVNLWSISLDADMVLVGRKYYPRRYLIYAREYRQWPRGAVFFKDGNPKNENPTNLVSVENVSPGTPQELIDKGLPGVHATINKRLGREEYWALALVGTHLVAMGPFFPKIVAEQAYADLTS